ncbi:MAG: hypothetical protein NVS1B4_24410 [Gemmatimonadaceae bacterium]
MNRYASIMVAAIVATPVLAAAQGTAGQQTTSTATPPAGTVRQEPAAKTAEKGSKGKHHKKRHRKHRRTSGGAIAPAAMGEPAGATGAGGRPTPSGAPDAKANSAPIVGGKAAGQMRMPPLPTRGDSIRRGSEPPTTRPPR